LERSDRGCNSFFEDIGLNALKRSDFGCNSYLEDIGQNALERSDRGCNSSFEDIGPNALERTDRGCNFFLSLPVPTLWSDLTVDATLILNRQEHDPEKKPDQTASSVLIDLR